MNLEIIESVYTFRFLVVEISQQFVQWFCHFICLFRPKIIRFPVSWEQLTEADINIWNLKRNYKLNESQNMIAVLCNYLRW